MCKKLAILFTAMSVAINAYGQNAVMVNKSNYTITYPSNFWTANASQGRTGLGLGSAATNASSAFQPSSLTLSNLASSNAVNLTNLRATNIIGTTAIINGGTGATNAAIARTNLELGLSALTNTNVSKFRTAIGLGETNTGVTFGSIDTAYVSAGGGTVKAQEFRVTDAGFLTFETANDATTWRANLGLGWPALTNTNAGTSLVSVNTNGSVVSPTNFWQAAPIQTLVQTFNPLTNSTNYGTNARNLYVYSMLPSISGVTNVIALPTNSATFDGDSATVTHRGSTSTVTAVRQVGTATNFVTISNAEESVKFIRESGQWTFYHNILFVEPIRFADINIEENRAISRTNFRLGLPALTNTNNANFQAAVFSTNTTPAGSAFNNIVAWMEVNVFTNGSNTSFRVPLFK
jgi:hypothetical protein